MGYRLGVDLGTTFTAAAVDDGSGPTMLGLGNRASVVPSVLFLGQDGTFVFGEAAERLAATDPTRAAREFKRRIGDSVPVLLAGQPFSPQALTAKLLSWVVSVAIERQGSEPDELVLTYPANWGDYKRELLRQLVSLADVPTVVTCTEPEAAATQYAARADIAAGAILAVYDLGGGTFDVCVLRKEDAGFTILGSPDGVEHLGGIDFDKAVFQHVVAMLPSAPPDGDREDPGLAAGVARLRRDCVEAKEVLSESVETVISVQLPHLSETVRLTRAELEGLIAVPLRGTLEATDRALRSAGVTATDLAAVVLVGGSSRIPLVSHLLNAELGVPTAMDTHPKHDVALGAARYRPGTAPPAAAADEPVVEWPSRGLPEVAEVAAPPPPGASARSRLRSPVVIAAAAVVAVIAGVAAVAAVTRGDDEGRTTSAATPTEPSRSEPGESPSGVTCWNGDAAANAGGCPRPTGAAGMAAVFPSFDEQECARREIRGVAGKLEVFLCSYGDHVIRYSHWDAARDRFAYYDRANPGALKQPWVLGGEPAGTQWWSFEDNPKEREPFQWSATYDDFEYSISVEGTTKEARRVGLRQVVARPPSEVGLD